MTKIIFPGVYRVEYDVQSIPSNTGGTFLTANFDLDQNGYTDFLLADGVFPPMRIRPTVGDIIYQNQSGFYLASNAFPGTVHPREYGFGDFNQDGVIDFFVAAHGYDAPPFPGEKNVLAVSSGQGYVENQPDLTAGDGFTHSVTTGDIDRDGDLDIFIFDITPNPQAYLYLNDGNGFFSDANHLLPDHLTLHPIASSYTSSLIHDIDGDGFSDILLGSQLQGQFGPSTILFGNKNENFASDNQLSLFGQSIFEENLIILDLKALDVDLDGDDDIITSYTLSDPAYTGAGIHIFRNDGNRIFTDISSEALMEQNFDVNENWIVFLEIVDFNDDGIQDIFINRAGAARNEPLVLLGDGGGNFYPLSGADIISDRNFDFLLGNTLPSFRNGALELAGAQFVEGEYIISRVNIEEPAIVQLDLKINEHFRPGTSRDDRLFGDGANNFFTPGTGVDFIDGGDGHDIVMLPNHQHSFTLSFTASDTILRDRSEFGYGQNELASIEELIFEHADQRMPFELFRFTGAVSLSHMEYEALIELYIAYFNRAPDAIGLNFWGTAFANGLSLDEIAAQFAPQPETVATYPEGTSNTEFATAVYNNVLGRVPDQAGLEFWVGVLDAGAVSRDQFILEILRGVEAGTSDRAYLDNKVDVGAYFAVHKGMSDVEHATAVMELFNGTESSIDQSITAIDDYYEAALDPENGEFLLQVVGVLDDPFSVA